VKLVAPGAGADLAVIQLPGGRRLAIAEWGDPDGRPVLHMHGLPGSRLEIHAEPDFYQRAGVRLITVDRPGYGLSDPHPAGTLLSWAADVEVLADRLRLGRFGLTAMSGGGPFALATAYRLGERLTGVALAGSIGPLDAPGAWQGIKLVNRLGLWSAAHFSLGVRLAYASMRLLLRVDPERFLDEMALGRPAGDRRLLATPALRRREELMLLEAGRSGVRGAVHEIGLLVRPWGFPLDRIQARVELFHGGDDDTAPLRHAQRLAETIPRSRLHVCVGEGHMVMWTHLGEILEAATGSAGDRRSPTLEASASDFGRLGRGDRDHFGLGLAGRRLGLGNQNLEHTV